jgi:LPXTG-motif cell wall-anchored protein
MYDESQRCSRTKMVLPLRVWLDGQAGENTPPLWAHTIDTSEIGCRLGGLRTELSPGQVVTLQRGQHKANFRVIWSKHLEGNENQAGIEALDQPINIWIVNPQHASTTTTEHDESVSASAPAVSFASNRPLPAPVIAHQRVAHQKSTLPATGSRPWFAFALGLSLLVLMLGGLFYYQSFREGGSVALGTPSPLPPTASDLARLTPKFHPLPAALTKPLDASTPRVQVAEAPKGYVVYPVAPDDSITGKVQLQIVVAANGLVKQIHVLSGKQPLVEAAAEAVRLWHYGSFQGAGRATDRETSVTVSFLGADAVSLEFPSQNGLLSAQRNKNN